MTLKEKAKYLKHTLDLLDVWIDQDIGGNVFILNRKNQDEEELVYE